MGVISLEGGREFEKAGLRDLGEFFSFGFESVEGGEAVFVVVLLRLRDSFGSGFELCLDRGSGLDSWLEFGLHDLLQLRWHIFIDLGLYIRLKLGVPRIQLGLHGLQSELVLLDVLGVDPGFLFHTCKLIRFKCLSVFVQIMLPLN